MKLAKSIGFLPSFPYPKPMSTSPTGCIQDLPFEYADQIWFAIDSIVQLELVSCAVFGPIPHYYVR